MSETLEKLEFKSELRQILHLITHSLYSHKEIFLRELISNASDAIDKIRFNSLDNEALLEGNKDWKIRLSLDKEARTLTVSDNGCGMDRAAIIENLGTIAKSGTRAFLERLQETDASRRLELIGQFGVGFYSAFMVADTVTVLSRAAGEPMGVKWVSDGQGEFTVEPCPKPGRGTDVILHLKAEEGDFLSEWRLRSIVKQFSDFIEHPIVMDVEKQGEGDAKTLEEEVLNSRKALWLRGKSEITAEEHNAFYRQISNDFEDPARVVHVVGEGTIEFKALLYIPRRKGFDLQFGEPKVGPKLYINRVQIMDHCEQLLPAYLRFVKGVVDCASLPLNVSREMLQQNPQLERIQKSLVKNVLKALAELQESEPATYEELFRELGGILKEGLARDWDHREQIADLLLFDSLKTEAGKTTTLAQYVAAMPAEQADVYYMTGESREALAHAPALEAFAQKGWDVLLLTEPIDPFVMPGLPDYKGKPLKAADRHVPEVSPADQARAEAAEADFRGLFETLKGRLADVKDLRLSRRLTTSAACLVADEGDLDPQMERLLARLGRGEGPGPRILELNPEHPTVKGLRHLHAQHPEDPRVEAYARLLHGQALIAEGSRLPDPAAFLQQVNALLARDLGQS